MLEHALQPSWSTSSENARYHPLITTEADSEIDSRSGIERMQASQFNLRVPLDEQEEVFLMNTLTDAQLVVSPDVAALLERANAGEFASFESVGSRQSAVT